ncbi:acyl-ACP--UDP-N-acetylglucosamine O-acyltransferase [bacterium]|nr:acyl-ACP--UDP-N-acetylglucosamine O-acyltransferase [bacterium]
MNIHPTAIIDPEAKIAEGVEIGPYSIIQADVEIGAECHISSNVLLASGTKLASGVKIFHGAVIGTAPQDLKYAGEKTAAEIGENTVIREFCTINRGTSATFKTVVGANCLLMAYTHVAHDCRIGDYVILANAVNMGGHVEIEEYAIIGGMVAIHQFINIGRHSMIGGLFRVPKDVPPYILAGGHPLRYEGLNVIGLKRRGFEPDQRKAIKEAYRLLYQSDLNTSQAIAKIKEGEITPEVKHIIDFFEASERGVI